MKAPDLTAIDDAGVHPWSGAHEALKTAATQAHLRFSAINLAKAKDRATLFAELDAALKLPEHFGHNWDAFYDCLVDLEHDKGEGLLVVLRDASGFARAEPDEFAAAVDALQDAADFWEDEQKTLLVVAELEAPVLAPELPEVSGR